MFSWLNENRKWQKPLVKDKYSADIILLGNPFVIVMEDQVKQKLVWNLE